MAIQETGGYLLAIAQSLCSEVDIQAFLDRPSDQNQTSLQGFLAKELEGANLTDARRRKYTELLERITFQEHKLPRSR